MQRIYFDNAATTALDPEVLAAMMPYLTEKFGNPSSIYSYGRETKLGVENARKTVAKILNAHPAEIFFTSCGTESSNTAITASIRDLGCRHIISSPIEHHATLHTVASCAKNENIPLSFVQLDEKGHVIIESLRELLEQAEGRCLVSLMHANNEIGNLLKVKNIGNLCKEYDAIFHCDTVQTVGHYPINVREMPVHFLTASAHKFHGPKGVGFLYVNEDISIQPMMHGGGQERNMRAGTENLYGIVGLARALELAIEHYEEDSAHIAGLKKYMKEQLELYIPGIGFNGDANGSSLYTVLNVAFPKTEKSEVLLFSLDMAGICASGGSACSSGASTGSHVIASIAPNEEQVPIRFSFCKYNTKEEVDTVIGKLKELI
jgi:cysteine desulfurase